MRFIYVYLYVVLKIIAVEEIKYVHESSESRELNSKFMQIRMLY